MTQSARVLMKFGLGLIEKNKNNDNAYTFFIDYYVTVNVTYSVCACGILQAVYHHSYLGLITDKRLNWRQHIDEVCTRLIVLTVKLSILKYKLKYKLLRTMYMYVSWYIIIIIFIRL